MYIDTRIGVGREYAMQQERWHQIKEWLGKDPDLRDIKVEVVSHQAILLKARGVIEKANKGEFSVDQVVPHLKSLSIEEDVTRVVLEREEESEEYRALQEDFKDLLKGLVEGELRTNITLRQGDGSYWSAKAKIATSRKLLRAATGKR